MDSFIHMDDHQFQVDLNSPYDISIPVDFEGEQLNYFNPHLTKFSFGFITIPSVRNLQ